MITKPPSNRTIIEGYAMAQLFCHATYDKSLDVYLTWLKNGEKMTFNDRVYMNKRITGLSGQILFFKNLEKSDSAKYTCHVYTSDGSYKVSEDKATASLSIVGKSLYFLLVCYIRGYLQFRVMDMGVISYSKLKSYFLKKNEH